MVVSAKGVATEGSTATLRYRSSLGVHFRFKVRIERVDLDREFRWVGRRLGISGDHYFRLMAKDSGTHFVHGEFFRGLLAGRLGFLFRDQVSVFETFNVALKDMAEHRFKSVGTRATGGTAPARR